ncbi:MAG: hypothetical protein EOO65_01280 [Methanosarcinales archaeon]|nr:MAG: hypothetical protein EOO65_01280 [Methanosarcinales archaeon]
MRNASPAAVPRNLQMLVSLGNALTEVLDMDHVLCNLVTTPKVATPRTARQSISALLSLKHVLQQVRATLSTTGVTICGTRREILKTFWNTIPSHAYCFFGFTCTRALTAVCAHSGSSERL